MNPKIGMITVGQSPRVDIVPHMSEIMGPHVQIIEKGALDGLSEDKIESLAPREGEVRLCTRLTDGRQVVVAKEHIIPLVQKRIHELHQESVHLIVLLCTGHFPKFESRCLVVEAEKIVDRCIEALIDDRQTIGLVVPLREQMDKAREKLMPVTTNICVVNATPYGSLDEIKHAAEKLKAHSVDLVVLHCMGFSNEHRSIMRNITGKPVLVANSMVARTLAELLAT